MPQQQMFGSFDQEMLKQALAAEEEKNLMAQARLSPAEVQRYVAASAGRQLGGIVGGIFGVEAQDPRLRQAQLAQEAYQEALTASGGDANSPQFFQAFANSAARRNLPTLAQQAAQQASTLQTEFALTRQRLAAASKERTEASPFSKIDPSKVTKESLAKFQQTGNITDLEFIPGADKGTEFERLIAGLSPTDQAAAKRNYLNKITGQVMPPATAALVTKDIDTLGGLSFTNSEVKSVINDLESDRLKLGLTNNFVNSFKTIAGKSDEGSRAYARFNGVLESLRNQSLRLNAGVQTEGDAIRALNEFMASYSKYDTKTAVEQLNRVVQKFDAAENSKRTGLIAIGNRYGEDLTPLLPTTTYKSPTATGAARYSDDLIMREFNDPKNSAWKSRGFDAFKKKFLELNK